MSRGVLIIEITTKKNHNTGRTSPQLAGDGNKVGIPHSGLPQTLNWLVTGTKWDSYPLGYL